ncbi:metallophosphoesterase [Paenibacillus pinisoli]|uniref:Metallophosphoesterase n=1 Tax=Paenibacillus pinisoli TaxID=1276110 RepID=A0A3A6PDK4_9BACL|nr:metallophosphoesterase [Paenibacillus pinisoli]RJX38827.1 metallophosphoesterase [Paenibacillus pinisoli]
MSRTKRWLLIYLPAAIVLCIYFLYAQNNSIVVTTYKVASAKLPDGFDSYRIVQLSDLQSKEFGKEQRPLIRKVDKLDPDVIVFTGDLVDQVHYDGEASFKLMEGLVKIAPVYFVRGNHEQASREYEELEERLLALGIHIMKNAHEDIPLGDGVIRLIGVDDPTYNRQGDGDADKMNAHLAEALADADGSYPFTVLLSHRTELFPVYAENGIDLSLTGHAHGGQIRIPFKGGVFSPGQGMWPEWTEGMHEIGDSAMIVNRGLGNSSFPLRLFNQPEIVVVELTAETAA